MSSTAMELSLPDEILLLIANELGQDREFGTVFACTQTSKPFAEQALRVLYRYHDQCPAFVQSDEVDLRQPARDFRTKTAEQASSYRKWTSLWRSIVISSIDGHHTYRPYCQYIRTLDFRNLSNMLEDFKFTNQVKSEFFRGELQRFHFPKKEFNRQTVDVVATINAIGESVTDKTSLLEEITGHLSPGFLTRWISRSPRLQSMVLWNGDALSNGAGASVASNCDNFRSLTIREWTGPDADKVFAEFLTELPPKTLTYFEMISYNTIGSAAFSALGRHSTLRELKLGNLDDGAMTHLHELKNCVEIETLVIEDNYKNVQLEALHNDVFEEVVAWLSSCTQLRDLTLKRMADAPSILARVATSPAVRLHKVSVEGYAVSNPASAAFHTALSEQKSLESVWLKGHGEETNPDDLDIMVDALCNLTNLRELVLKDVSDEFEERHIVSLALHLPLLEDFWTSGGEVGPGLLEFLSMPKHLKNLTLYALTQFDLGALLEFVDRLDADTQKGFSLSLMAADPQHDLLEEEQQLIRDTIRTKLDGRFDFVLWREADLSEDEDD